MCETFCGGLEMVTLRKLRDLSNSEGSVYIGSLGSSKFDENDFCFGIAYRFGLPLIISAAFF